MCWVSDHLLVLTISFESCRVYNSYKKVDAGNLLVLNILFESYEVYNS